MISIHVSDPWDEAGQAKVEFQIDSTAGSPVQVELANPYCLGGSGSSSCHPYDTSGFAAGSYKVIMLAFDSDGNVGRASRSFQK